MRRKNLALTAASLGVLAATAVAWGVTEGETAAGPERKPGVWGPRWGHRHGGDPVAMMTRHLDLTDAQETKIRGILDNARSEGEALRDELAEMRQQLQTSIRADGYYEDQVRMLVEAKSPVFVELTMLGIRTMSQVYAELTPEQKAQADAMLDSPGGRFGRWRHFDSSAE